ncbi:MalY/PatB family protein [Aliamphritea ceti]|uniref:MalY/PatB family protein n=1 Tax=Aliamphritea ceti TaxID=1524258 RepID=UPI0021C34C32|nr:aminotransferase class I/II-fold pyridoxal phosphate-dependent enzyme [Aliamphritea ceti]
MSFDQSNAASHNNFIRNSSSMLQGIFGTTDVMPFWVADMDFTVAEPVKAELLRLANRGQYAYEFNSEGVFAAISDWFKRRHQLQLDTDKFVQVSGVLTAIALLIRELTDKGEGVLIQTPAYHQFSKVISTAGREIIKSPLLIEDGRYVMNFADLDEKMRVSDVNVMILCNPHNPVGRVWTQDELQTLLKLANKHGVTIISDEIHADIIHSGHRFTSVMALEPDNHVSLIGSPSKTFGMQSISNGYIYTGNQKILEAMRAVSASMYLDHGNAFTTFATIAAFNQGEAWVDELLEYLRGNIDWISNFLQTELPEIKMFPVEGTYQVWLDFSATGLSGETLTKTLGKAGFGASPGSWFDSDASQFARMNFAASKADIEIAFKRLKTVLTEAAQAEIAPVAAPEPAKSSKSCC